MGQVTVNSLINDLMVAKAKGYGNHVIAISDDNEGNGYHGLFFGVLTDIDKDILSMVSDSNHNADGSNLIILG